MQPRKDVMAYIYHPRKRLVHVVVEVRGEEHMAELFSSLDRLGLTVVGGFTSPNGGRGRLCSLFTEARDDRVTASGLRALLESQKYVLRCWAREARSGFLVDGAHFPLTLNTGQRVVLLGQQRIARIFQRLGERFGSPAAQMLYEEGYELGRSTAEVFIHYVLGERFVRENIEEVLMIYSAVGWGRPELARYEAATGEGVVILRGCFECEGLRTGRPSSHFVRGHLCGMLSTISGTRLACEEARCLASGHEYCEFRLTPGDGGKPHQGVA